MSSGKLGNNHVCLDHDTCESAICSDEFCAQCLADTDCTENQCCNLFGDCTDKFGNNHVCLANKECASGISTLGCCAECAVNAQVMRVNFAL